MPLPDEKATYTACSRCLMAEADCICQRLDPGSAKAMTFELPKPIYINDPALVKALSEINGLTLSPANPHKLLEEIGILARSILSRIQNSEAK